LTLRGQEHSSVLLAVRASLGNRLECLYWERQFEGTFKRRGGSTTRANAYTRILVGKVHMGWGIGYIGNNHAVAVVHLHHQAAKKPGRLQEWFRELACILRKLDVRILMGNFNMALWEVVPRLRSCGVVLDMAAYYPWKNKDCKLMTDTCGIFVVGIAAGVRLYHGEGSLHDRDESGLLSRQWPTFDERRGRAPFEIHNENGGPGKPIESFLPRGMDAATKMRRSFVPSFVHDENAAVAASPKDDKGEVLPGFLKVCEKRLDEDNWLMDDGLPYKGSHFPLVCFAHNESRRSPEAHAKRALRSREKWQAKSWTQWQAASSSSGAPAAVAAAGTGNTHSQPQAEHPQPAAVAAASSVGSQSNSNAKGTQKGHPPPAAVAAASSWGSPSNWNDWERTGWANEWGSNDWASGWWGHSRRGWGWPRQ